MVGMRSALGAVGEYVRAPGRVMVAFAGCGDGAVGSFRAGMIAVGCSEV